MTIPAAVERIQTHLQAQADEGRRDWWTRYMKGTASFRGVTMAQVRAEVDALWAEEVSAWPPAEAKALALALLRQEQSEDKLAGILLLAEKLLDELDAADLDWLAEPFEDGSIGDWGICDWFSVKLLAKLCARDGRAFAASLAEWTSAASLWQRRAPAVALAPLAGKPEPFEGFAELCVAICEPLAADPQRFSQTAVGWLMRELSKQRPEVTLEFVAAYEGQLSREAMRMATAKIEGRGRR